MQLRALLVWRRFWIVPVLMILGGLSMMSAAASSLIAVKSAAGFIGYQQLVATGQSRLGR